MRNITWPEYHPKKLVQFFDEGRDSRGQQWGADIGDVSFALDRNGLASRVPSGHLSERRGREDVGIPTANREKRRVRERLEKRPKRWQGGLEIDRAQRAGERRIVIGQEARRCLAEAALGHP